MEDLQDDLLVVHCFCMCGGGALLGHLLGVSRSVECDLFVLSSPRFLLDWVLVTDIAFY